MANLEDVEQRYLTATSAEERTAILAELRAAGLVQLASSLEGMAG